MIAVPRVSELLGSETPACGGIDEIEQLRRFVADVSRTAGAYVQSISRALSECDRENSRALTALVEKLRGRLLPGADRLRSSAETGERALSGYAAEVDRFHGEARTVQQEIDAQLASIISQASTIERISELVGARSPERWDAPPPGRMPEPLLPLRAEELSRDERELAIRHLRATHETEWLLAASAWREAVDRVEAAGAQWRRLLDERRLAEQRLVSALGTTALGHLIAFAGGTGRGDGTENGPTSRGELSRTVGLGLAGELRGAIGAGRAPAVGHPLLRRLLGSGSGSAAWDDPPRAGALASSWAGLSADEQALLIGEVPWVVGNLPGLPAAARDAANRRQLDFYREHPYLLDEDGLELVSEVSEIVASTEPPTQVLSLDLTAEEPRVAIGYGDIDRAERVSWAIPGMNSDADRAIGGESGWDRAGRNIFAAQREAAGGSSAHAVVIWLGYDTPDAPPLDWGVLGSRAADRGAARLAVELDGLHASRSHGGAAAPAVNVVAHSYGTTVAALALARVSQPVDAFIMLGSAGLDADPVAGLDALQVREASPGQLAVYTTHASADHLAPVGAGLSRRAQPNPGATGTLGLHAYSPTLGGALAFPSDGDLERGLTATDGHTTIGAGPQPGWQGFTASRGRGYLDTGTQSLDSVAQILSDRVDERLRRSFVRTETRCIAYEFDGDRVLPRREECVR